MPRVHYVKKAKKKNPAVKKGEPYYWWKFRRSKKQYSASRPRASQLTQSEFLGQVYDLTDQIQEFDSNDEDERDSFVEDIAQQIRDLGEEQEEKINNMPESLQESPTGELLRERAEACEIWADELESIDSIDGLHSCEYVGE